MHINTIRHDHIRLYNIILNEIKIQAYKEFSCIQVSCKLLSTLKIEKKMKINIIKIPRISNVMNSVKTSNRTMG